MRSCKKVTTSRIFVQSDIDTILAYATQEFKLGSGEGSLRSKLEAAAKQTGQPIKELEDLVECPDTMRFVWSYFIDLHNCRTSNGFGVNPIQYGEIESYFNLLEIQPAEWEIQTIKRLDVVAMKTFAEEAEKQSKKQQTKKSK